MSEAEDVVQQHIEAFRTRDVDVIVADFAEDVVVQTPYEVVRGRDELRTWFGGILDLLPPGTETVVDSVSSVDDVVLVTWHADTDAFSLPLVVDTHIVRDGKIAATTMAYHLVPR